MSGSKFNKNYQIKFNGPQQQQKNCVKRRYGAKKNASENWRLSTGKSAIGNGRLGTH